MLGQCAIQGQSADRNRDGVGQYDPQHSAEETDGQGFRQELQKDIAATRAERLFHSDFTGALRDRYQHDVHQADTTDPQGERPNESEQNLKAHGDDMELVHLLHEVEDEHRTAVAGIELVLLRDHAADRPLQAQVVVHFIPEPDGLQVVGIGQVPHGGERDIYDAVYIVIAVLHFMLQDADHFEAQAVNPAM